MDNILEIKNVSKKIGKKKILKDISLEVKEGEIFGFVGPNGAGKTTLIKTMLGLYAQDSGTIKIGGYDIKKDFEKASPVTPFEYAGMIVKMITDYCSIDEFGKTRLQLYDKDGKERNVSFKDFMILGRTRSEFIAVEYELKKAERRDDWGSRFLKLDKELCGQ